MRTIYCVLAPAGQIFPKFISSKPGDVVAVSDVVVVRMSAPEIVNSSDFINLEAFPDGMNR